MSVQPEPAAIATLRDHVLGKTVASIHIHGINSLKSLDPSPDDVAGQAVTGLEASPDGRQLELRLDRTTIAVDLARTGMVVALAATRPWAPAGRATPPTGRLIFADGSGVDFKEAARTKRITFTLRYI